MIVRIVESVCKIALLGAQPMVIDLHYHCHYLLNNIKVIIVVIITTTIPHNKINIQHHRHCHGSEGSWSRFMEPRQDGPG